MTYWPMGLSIALWVQISTGRTDTRSVSLPPDQPNDLQSSCRKIRVKDVEKYFRYSGSSTEIDRNVECKLEANGTVS
jgi:hypothetical protein